MFIYAMFTKNGGFCVKFKFIFCFGMENAYRVSMLFKFSP